VARSRKEAGRLRPALHVMTGQLCNAASALQTAARKTRRGAARTTDLRFFSRKSGGGGVDVDDAEPSPCFGSLLGVGFVIV
jgi:hypothetical protein